eukprot:symbB.v1.2.000695.t1/scaffold41.1/size391900/12
MELLCRLVQHFRLRSRSWAVVQFAHGNSRLLMAGLAIAALLWEGLLGRRHLAGRTRRPTVPRDAAGPATDASQVLEWLFIGGERAASNRIELIQNHITHVLNCCERLPFSSHRTQNERLHLKDSRDESLSSQLSTAFTFLDKVQEEKGRCLVHCRKGASRSVAIVLAYLVLRQRYRLRDAWRLIQSKRPVARPNVGYCRQLVDFEKTSTGVATMKPSEFHSRSG